MSILYSLASATLIATPLIMTIMLAKPLFDRKYAANGRYFLWMLVMGALILPFVSAIPSPIRIDMPALERPAAYPAERAQTALPVPIPNPVESVHTIAMPNPVVEFIPIIWLIGFIVMIAYQTLGHLLFMSYVRRRSAPEDTIAVVALFNATLTELDIRKCIALKRCLGIDAPMLAGIIRPTVLLPYASYDDGDLSFIFRHELIHFKRRDLWYKLALGVVKSLHWFNPAVHLLARQADKDIEMICDGLTVRGMCIDSRKKYSTLILNMAAGRGIRHSQFATSMKGDAKMLKQRFANIFNNGKKRGVALFVTLGLIVGSLTTLVGFNFDADTSDAVICICGSICRRIDRQALYKTQARIENSLTMIRGVRSAVVELYIPAYCEADGEPAASVVLVTTDQFNMEAVGTLARIVQRSVLGLELDNIEIVVESNGYIWHEVMAGDTLSGLAIYYLGHHSRWTEIYDLNRLPTANLRIGQILLIPPH